MATSTTTIIIAETITITLILIVVVVVVVVVVLVGPSSSSFQGSPFWLKAQASGPLSASSGRRSLGAARSPQRRQQSKQAILITKKLI